MTDEGDDARPAHPGVDEATAGDPTPDDADAQYRTGETDERPDEPEDEPAESFFARVPESVVSLGSGALLTTALLTTVAALFTGYSAATGTHFGFEPYQILLAALQFFFASALQWSGLYFARQRVRWLWVMLAALSGIFSIIGLPFAILAVVCLFLGRYHFASYTPSERLKKAMS